ncbi:membrane protein insertase YidC [Oleiharenicola sp. Vm1]|uniref:membrane protein insertase YidC n=1 Tax=Oleiharenicola sp. Vm1 TaxID=3398393 RepID=UPI0039F53F21
MDKKNTAIGVLLLVAAMLAFYFSAKFSPPPPKPAIPSAPVTSPVATNAAPAAGPATSPADTTLTASKTPSSAPAEYVTLANDFVTVRFTTAGGAIDRVELKKHKAELGHDAPYLMNAPQAAPALSFGTFPGVDKDARYELVSHDAHTVVYRTMVDGKLEVTRRYELLGGGAGDPYQVRHETTFRNLGAQPLPLPRTSLNLGTASPLGPLDTGMYVNAGYYNGDSTEFIRRDELAGGGFFTSSPPLPFLDKVAPITWAAVKNQFFAAILTPDEPGVGLRIERVKINPLAPAEDRNAYAVTGELLVDLKPIPANGSAKWSATYYAGPKEYRRLARTDNFKQSEDKVMNFAPFFFNKIFLSQFFGPLLLTLLTWVHAWIPSWGWAIVVMTILLKVVTLPFTLAASRSAKRMQKLMPLIQESREKYKDNPQKAQEAMMRIYKENKVNPLGGCIPILITMPLFIGFFAVLQGAAELRYAPFLWAVDLSAPDTVYSFGAVTLPLLGLTHLNINILPVLMGATMIYQMKLTPTAPNVDPAQATMMKIMPWMFALFCYNFASALALYSTVNALFSIGQQMFINKMPEPELAGATGPDGLKNVTPKKKK